MDVTKGRTGVTLVVAWVLPVVTWALLMWKGAPNERARDTRIKDSSKTLYKTFYTQEATGVRGGERKTTSQHADTPATNRSHRCYRYH